MKKQHFPKISLTILTLIVLASVFADWLAPYGLNEMHVEEMNLPPSMTHIFGTDNMGRDLFTMVLYGGRASLFIGLGSTLIATVIALIYGTISGLAGKKIDDFLMRAAELMMSIPSILLILFLQAMWGETTYLSLSVVIGVTGWMHIAKIVRSEVRQIGNSDYILAAKTMDGGFWYILRRHLLPNFLSSIMFMVVSNIGQAMMTEATLSFLGLGLPLSTVSWGSLLSTSQDFLMTGSWWMIILPGFVLITTLICVTEIGEYMRKKNNRIYSNL